MLVLVPRPFREEICPEEQALHWKHQARPLGETAQGMLPVPLIILYVLYCSAGPQWRLRLQPNTPASGGSETLTARPPRKGQSSKSGNATSVTYMAPPNPPTKQTQLRADFPVAGLWIRICMDPHSFSNFQTKTEKIIGNWNLIMARLFNFFL